METLLKNNRGNKWNAQRIDSYRDNLKLKYGTPNRYRVRSNFAYNMQYLEYLQKQIKELNLSSVIITMTYKSYIIVAMGIIEMLFASLLKATKNWKTTDKELILTTSSNFQKHGKQQLLTVTELYKKIDRKKCSHGF